LAKLFTEFCGKGSLERIEGLYETNLREQAGRYSELLAQVWGTRLAEGRRIFL
jgi:hypothetical protein